MQHEKKYESMLLVVISIIQVAFKSKSHLKSFESFIISFITNYRMINQSYDDLLKGMIDQ